MGKADRQSTERIKGASGGRVMRAVLRRDFPSFVARVFATVDPSAEFLPNWHIELLGDYLRAVEKGEVRRLIINLPPRSLKSVCVSVAWPAWLLGHDPAKRVIGASYSASLAEKHAADFRLVAGSDWYRRLFPAMRVKAGENHKAKLVTLGRGFRLATSVGGTLTGEGGDILIADDLMNPAQAMSDRQRETAIRWFEQTLMSRLNRPELGAVVVVMQRLHPEDLTGRLLRQGGWEHLCLPALNERPRRVGGKDWAAGEALHPARMNENWLEAARRELGEMAFQAQYLQRPAPPEGGLVRRKWFRYWG